MIDKQGKIFMWRVSEPRIILETDLRKIDGDQRRMADRQTLLCRQGIRLIFFLWVFLSRIFRKNVTLTLNC